MTIVSLVCLLVIFPAALGYYFFSAWVDGQRIRARVRVGDPRGSMIGVHPGDLLIYRKPKVSQQPGPRALNVQASKTGEDYSYEVDKFWTVADVLEDGRVIALTRTGKQVSLRAEDLRVRKPGLIERVRYRGRFPEL